LSWSTQQQNCWDKIENGTLTSARLEPMEVLEIKEKIINGESLQELSLEFLISVPVLSSIKHNKIWKTIGPDVSKYKNQIPTWFKLSTNDIIQIKILLRDKKLSQFIIADMYEIDQSMVSKIKTGKHHSDIQIPPGM
jgi:predicted XRE-type DNA-binding protein